MPARSSTIANATRHGCDPRTATAAYSALTVQYRVRQFRLPGNVGIPQAARDVDNFPLLEHFPEKWMPVFRKKMRQNKVLDRFPTQSNRKPVWSSTTAAVAVNALAPAGMR